MNAPADAPADALADALADTADFNLTSERPVLFVPT